MKHGRMWRGLVELFPQPHSLLCPVLRCVFSSTALSGFLGNTKCAGILLGAEEKLLCHLQGLFVCVLPAFLGKARPPTVLQGRLCGDGGRGERGGSRLGYLPSPVFCTAHLQLGVLRGSQNQNAVGRRGHLGAFHRANLSYPSDE